MRTLLISSTLRIIVFSLPLQLITISLSTFSNLNSPILSLKIAHDLRPTHHPKKPAISKTAIIQPNIDFTFANFIAFGSLSVLVWAYGEGGICAASDLVYSTVDDCKPLVLPKDNPIMILTTWTRPQRPRPVHDYIATATFTPAVTALSRSTVTGHRGWPHIHSKFPSTTSSKNTSY
jgi:hypothetical protein